MDQSQGVSKFVLQCCVRTRMFIYKHNFVTFDSFDSSAIDMTQADESEGMYINIEDETTWL